MEDSEIIEFIRELESHVPIESAEAKFAAFGEVALYANKDGYLRMALELMKCAFDETYLEADMNDIFSKDSDFGIEHLTRDKNEFDIISS
ncbi:hypothetical protein CW745_16375 [Psychromonas sp. psych-6C06]|uniref:hypothetical protein n=1 Tax=Psychromonas sp. psych-6C06 TaxID=2058089 RepID=UPI000C3328A6|nr:hypothetical protein [Psychromonas sp. psych-6C06]PKF60183.1 hypothetical protein CW745_16375 [Psychromonas sp. psych-6C06]